MNAPHPTSYESRVPHVPSEPVHAQGASQTHAAEGKGPHSSPLRWMNGNTTRVLRPTPITTVWGEYHAGERWCRGGEGDRLAWRDALPPSQAERLSVRGPQPSRTSRSSRPPRPSYCRRKSTSLRWPSDDVCRRAGERREGLGRERHESEYRGGEQSEPQAGRHDGSPASMRRFGRAAPSPGSRAIVASA